MRVTLTCVVLVLALAGCEDKSKQAGGPPVTGPRGEVKAGGGPAAKATITGKVLETMDSGGYTYIRMNANGNERWVAVPGSKVSVGDTVTIRDAVEMQTFTSKTLNRTFERILFGQLGAGPASAPAAMGAMGAKGMGALPPGHPPMGGAGGKAPDGKAMQHPPVAPPAKVADLKVPKATGAGANTVAGVFADSAKLKDKPIVVNGVVVKVNTGIMNKNWIHLQDGTGTVEKKDNDLVFTTLDTAKVGDKVKATGTVRKDKDFGFGYKYATIVEEAKVEPLK